VLTKFGYPILCASFAQRVGEYDFFHARQHLERKLSSLSRSQFRHPSHTLRRRLNPGFWKKISEVRAFLLFLYRAEAESEPCADVAGGDLGQQIGDGLVVGRGGRGFGGTEQELGPGFFDRIQDRRIGRQVGPFGPALLEALARASMNFCRKSSEYATPSLILCPPVFAPCTAPFGSAQGKLREESKG